MENMLLNIAQHKTEEDAGKERGVVRPWKGNVGKMPSIW